PAWLTDQLEAQIVAAGPKGVEIARPDASVNPDCLGTAPPYAGTDGVSTTAVSAGTCMVSPAGCTMNFVFTDGTSSYIGTAGHCAGNGKTVIAQVGTRVDPTDTVFVTLAAIGTVVKSWNNGIGKDFALVKIDPGFKVVPGVAGALGPTGLFCGDPVGQPVMHYGHGYIFFVEQGYAKSGSWRAGLRAPNRLRDGEEAEHDRLVRLAVELPLALLERHGHRLLADERDARERLLELSARLLLDHEAVDRGLVADRERVAAGLQLRHLLRASLERDRVAGPTGALQLGRRRG